MAKMPRIEIEAKARCGQIRKFRGVPLAEVLRNLEAPSGKALQGSKMNYVVLISAKDGYQVAFSLCELDFSFRSQNAIIADEVDGFPLDEFEGPLMLVLADDLRHSRWIRQITRIALIRAEMPKP